MNNYEEWAQLVAKNLKGEADLIAAIEKDELDDAAATQAFIRAVLEPFLPENFGIGSGRVVDALGNYSDHLDIIIYDRDYPRIGLRGTHAAYLYESVFAVFAIRAKFVRKTFFDALTCCASLADLNASIDKLTMAKLAKKNGLTRDSGNKFVHRDPLRTARFNLIGRPPAFLFGFTGIKNSYRQLQENVELWIDQRRKVGAEAEMKSLPAVIATQGCFAWRNAAPLALSNREMLGIGNDSAPIRLIVMQLLYLLNRRLNTTTDSYGLKPSLKAYLSQFSPPKFELGIGNVAEVVSLKPATEAEQQVMQDAAPKLVAALDRAPPEAAAAPDPVPEAIESPAAKMEAAFDRPPPSTAAAPEPVSEVIESPAAKMEAAFDRPPPSTATAPEPVSEVIESPAAKMEAAFDRPPPSTAAAAKPAIEVKEPWAPEPFKEKPPLAAPLGSAPIPTMGEPAAPKTAPLGSAPIPTMDEPAAPKTAPLGSAPIPQMNESESDDAMPVPELDPEPAPEPVQAKAKPDPAPEPVRVKAKPETVPAPAAPASKSATGNKVVPPKPPVDFDLTGETEAVAKIADVEPDKENEPEDDFAQTVVMPPPETSNKDDGARNSTDAFIARVKQQLSSSEPVANPDKEQDSFSSTIPQ